MALMDNANFLVTSPPKPEELISLTPEVYTSTRKDLLKQIIRNSPSQLKNVSNVEPPITPSMDDYKKLSAPREAPVIELPSTTLIDSKHSRVPSNKPTPRSHTPVSRQATPRRIGTESEQEWIDLQEKSPVVLGSKLESRKANVSEDSLSEEESPPRKKKSKYREERKHRKKQERETESRYISDDDDRGRRSQRRPKKSRKRDISPVFKPDMEDTWMDDPNFDEKDFLIRLREGTDEERDVHTKAQMLVSSKEMPNFNDMSGELRMACMCFYHVKMDNLIFLNPSISLKERGIDDFRELTLIRKHRVYHDVMEKLIVETNLPRWQMFYVLGLIAVYLICTKFLGLPIDGFLKNQYNKLERYNAAIIEMGLKWSGSGSKWGPEANLLFGVGMDLLIYMFIYFLVGYFGAESATDMVNEVIQKIFFDGKSAEEVAEEMADNGGGAAGGLLGTMFNLANGSNFRDAAVNFVDGFKKEKKKAPKVVFGDDDDEGGEYQE